MEDEMNNKFTKTDDLKVVFEQEKIRLASIRTMIQQYKPALSR